MFRVILAQPTGNHNFGGMVNQVCGAKFVQYLSQFVRSDDAMLVEVFRINDLPKSIAWTQVNLAAVISERERQLNADSGQ